MAQFKEYIVGERACDKCGYDLNGLPKDGECPECGHPIRRAVTSGPRSGTMSVEAPTGYVRLLLIGFLILSISILGMVMTSLSVRAIATSQSISMRAIGSLVYFGSHAMWPIGIWIIATARPMTHGRVPNAILDSDRFRLIIRVVAIAWIVKALMLYAYHAGAGAAVPTNKFGLGLLLFGYICSSVIGWVGLVPTSIYMGDLAYWSSNDSIGHRLRSTAWAMGVFGTILAVTSAMVMANLPFRGPAGFIGIFSLLIILIAIVFFTVTVMQFTHVLRWVIKHQLYAAGSRGRIDERIQANQAQPGHVHNGLKCRYCKYDLDGLAYGGRCPECGESYADDTPFPIRDPALSVTDSPEVELAESSHQEILPYDPRELGRSEQKGDDGPIPLE